MENTMTNDEVMQELLKILKQNSIKKEASDIFEICNYIDSLQGKIEEMQDEISNLELQLKEMQNDTMLNKLREEMSKAQTKVADTYTQIRKEFFIVKESIKSKALEITNEFKKKGRAALGKIYEIFNVKDKLVKIRTHVKESQEEISHTLDKIEVFSAGMSEASHIFKNTFREALDKQAKDYSEIEKKIKMSDVFKKPWRAKQKILEGMEKVLDGAIDKVTVVQKEVELNSMLKVYDRLESKSSSAREVMPMVAETEPLYGADEFEKYMESHNSTFESKEKDDRIVGKISEILENGKGR